MSTPTREAHQEPEAGGATAVPAYTHEEPMPEGEELAPPGTRAMAVVRWLIVLMVAVAAAWSVGSYLGHGHGGAEAAEGRFHCPMHPSVIQGQPGECPICGMDLVPVVDHGSASTAPPAAAPLPAGHEGHRHEPSDPYFCEMHPEETALEATTRCPLCKMKLTRRQPAFALPAGHEGHRHEPSDPYFCEMHPEETAIEATTSCPLCKMKLTRREPAAGASVGEGVTGLVPIELSPERIQLAGARTARAVREALTSEIRTVGAIAASEASLARVQTRFSGWIEELLVAETGAKVEKGQVLARIYSPELLNAQQEYLNARRWARTSEGGADLAANLGEDARRKLELLGVPAQQIDEIEQTGKPVRALELRSPVRGHVLAKNAQLGLFVQPGSELFQIADLGRVWLVAEVYEHEIGRVKLGQQAHLELGAYPGKQFTGKVEFVYHTLDPETRTLRVRLAFKNPELELKPGMYGDVTLLAAPREALLVPREAVVDTGTEQYIFLARERGRFEPRRVRLGQRSGEKVEVLAGLTEGEAVVTTGNFLIDSESRLRSAIEGMGAVAPATHAHGERE